MKRKRNILGQFVSKDSNEYYYMTIPGPLLMIKIILIILVISPWLFIFFYRVNLKEIMEFIFGIQMNNELNNKKSNDFF